MKEGNVLFNVALNTFYLWLYDVRHMVKDHLDRERGNPLPPHELLFPISSKVFFKLLKTLVIQLRIRNIIKKQVLYYGEYYSCSL